MFDCYEIYECNDVISSFWGIRIKINEKKQEKVVINDQNVSDDLIKKI